MPEKSKSLTDMLIKNAKPTDKRYELPDGGCPGLYLVVQQSGEKSFAFRYRHGTLSRKLTLGRYPVLTLGAARAAVKTHRATLAKNLDPHAAKMEARREAEKTTVKSLCERYIEWSKAENSPKWSAETERYCRQIIIPELGAIQLESLTHEQVENFLSRVLHRKTDSQKRLRGGGGGDGVTAPVASNRCRSILSKAINLAPKFGLLPHDHQNPTKGTPKNRERPRRRFAAPDELGRLAEALDQFENAHPREIAALWCLFLTGARVSEIARARASEFRGDRVVLTAHKTEKYIGEKIILLPVQAQRILSQVKPDGDYLFDADKLRDVWQDVRERAGCPDLQLRDARRTFASAAKSAGKTLDQIGEIFGHRSTQTTRGYAWLFDDAKRATVDAIADTVSGFMRRSA